MELPNGVFIHPVPDGYWSPKNAGHSDVATGRGLFSLSFDNQALTVRSSPPILYHSS
ncbi:hypothetical protein HRF87_23330 [Bacillus sp. CRN 9]|nr:hypothetical protein [Bacillus sp. CRN 9]